MTKLDKILNKLSRDVIEDMQGFSKEDLESTIVSATTAIECVKNDLEALPAYQEAKENMKALRGSYLDTKKFQGAKIAYALYLLGEKSEQ